MTSGTSEPHVRMDVGGELVWQADYGPWRVEARLPAGGEPFVGPSKLTISLSVGAASGVADRVAQARETDGIPASLLRQIPLAEIKAQARAVLAQGQSRESDEPWPVPARCRTELDYVLLVAELVRMRATGTTAPQQSLADRLGIGKATLSERVKRARALDLWDGKQLTDKASALLVEWKKEREG
ncbi:helix-turn-helix domain-containing protein [Kitasatospora sp. NPDC096204]|uniref:helix-turn-helix domain-containing protein n=1 Tax=Kitasatospora sp. NPDC096204 TaxID=3364094 RepID=UPI00381D8A7C